MFNGYELWLKILHVFNGKSNDKARNLNFWYNLKKAICWIRVRTSQIHIAIYSNSEYVAINFRLFVVCNFKFIFDASRQVFEILSFRSICTHKNV